MRIVLLATALFLFIPGTGHTGTCPDSLTRDLREGVLLPGRIEAIAAGMEQLGTEVCGAPLIMMAREELTSRTPSGVGAVATLWSDPKLLPLLYSAYAKGMLRPHERSDDLALAMADAIKSISDKAFPERDLLAPLREPAIGLDWLDQSASRFTVEWQPAIESGELILPLFSEEVRGTAYEEFLRCIDDPESVPADTFDPLGLATGPGARLSIGTRCSTLAVLASFRSGASEDEAEKIDNLLRQYSPMGDFLDLAAMLERDWKQGRSKGQPSLSGSGHWLPSGALSSRPSPGGGPLSRTPFVVVVVVALGLVLLLGAVARLASRQTCPT